MFDLNSHSTKLLLIKSFLQFLFQGTKRIVGGSDLLELYDNQLGLFGWGVLKSSWRNGPGDMVHDFLKSDTTSAGATTTTTINSDNGSTNSNVDDECVFAAKVFDVETVGGNDKINNWQIKGSVWNWLEFVRAVLLDAIRLTSNHVEICAISLLFEAAYNQKK